MREVALLKQRRVPVILRQPWTDFGLRICRVVPTAARRPWHLEFDRTVEERSIMLFATSQGQAHCPASTLKPRAAFGALLAALGSLCSHTAFAQMERMNSTVHAQLMATAAPDVAAAADAAAPNPDCTLMVPSSPLSAKGLSTPF